MALIGLIQVCPAPPAVLGPIIIAADGAVGGSAIAAGINHSKNKRADEMDEHERERLRASGCHNWPVRSPHPRSPFHYVTLQVAMLMLARPASD